MQDFQIQTRGRSCFARIQGSLHCQTDLDGDMETRSGNLIHEESHPAGKPCSSYTGECITMLRALKWIQKNPLKSCTICTDSLSLHQSLAKDNWRDKDEWLKQEQRTILELDECLIHVLWIPSHCETRMKEQAPWQKKEPILIREARQLATVSSRRKSREGNGKVRTLNRSLHRGTGRGTGS